MQQQGQKSIFLKQRARQQGESRKESTYPAKEKEFHGQRDGNKVRIIKMGGNEVQGKNYRKF